MINFGSIINWAANSIPVVAIANLAVTVKAYTLDSFAAPAADVSMNSKKLTNLATGTATTDGANKGQMDSADAATLASGKTYADSGDAATLASAKTYADGKVATAGTVKKFATTITGDGTKTTFQVTHNLNSMDVNVYLRDGTDGTLFLADAPPSDANTVTITLNFAPASGKTYRVVVQG